MKTLMNKVDLKIKTLKEIAEKNFKTKIPEFQIDYDLNGTSSLGMVSYDLGFNKPRMRLHYNLLKEFGEQYINEVVTHEFAHIVIRNLFPTGFNGRKKVNAHGTEFKAVCSHFGIVGKSTTGLFTHAESIKKNNTFSYSCGCMVHELSLVKHNRMKRGQFYKCSVCGNRLEQIKKAS